MAPASELIQYPVCLALGYLIGSFPTAFLLVKWRRRLDIRSAGSGNVGAMNTYDVTGSRLLGLVVLLLDLAKGAAAPWLAAVLFPGSLWVMGCAGIGAVAGHSFSAWLRFRGGRGLATCAGVMLVMAWTVVLLWVCIWCVHYAVSRNLHGANIVATVVSPPVIVVLPAALTAPMQSHGGSLVEFVLMLSVMCAIILIRHAGYFAKAFSSSTTT